MAPEIDQAVFSWSNFLLQLFRRQIPEQFLRSLHIGLPPAQRGVNERLLRSHSSPSFYLNESRVVSHVSAALSIRPALCRRQRTVRYPCRNCSHSKRETTRPWQLPRVRPCVPSGWWTQSAQSLLEIAD